MKNCKNLNCVDSRKFYSALKEKYIATCDAAYRRFSALPGVQKPLAFHQLLPYIDHPFAKLLTI